MKINIKYKPGAYQLAQIDKGDWIDLYTYETVELQQGEFKLIDLGIAMQLPEKYEAIVAPRSSTFKKYGLLQANSIGIIDNSYCGNSDYWMWPAYATKNITIPAGTRLCQFRVFENQPSIEFKELSQFDAIDRGGFGSTGD